MTPSDMTALADRLSKFADFINEPPQYEELRMVRDYRHDLARMWLPLLNDLLVLAAPPSGSAGAIREALLEIQQSVQDISDRAYEAGDAPKALGDIVGMCGPIIDKLSILAAADGPQAQPWANRPACSFPEMAAATPQAQETPREREALELLHRAFQYAKLPPKLEGDIGKFLGAVTRPERGTP